MIFYQWIKDGWKRATLLFKTLFLPSRYDSRLPRYHRAKGKVIFHRSLPLVVRSARTGRLAYLKLETSDSRDS